jgi:hypothetical protein
MIGSLWQHGLSGVDIQNIRLNFHLPVFIVVAESAFGIHKGLVLL